LQGLIGVGVGRSVQRLRPIRSDAPALCRRPRAAVPSDLLHRVIELDAMSVRTDGIGGVVDAGVKGERDVIDEAQSLLLQKGDRILQLR
jgi:hypothetical protein